MRQPGIAIPVPRGRGPQDEWSGKTLDLDDLDEDTLVPDGEIFHSIWLENVLRFLKQSPERVQRLATEPAISGYRPQDAPIRSLRCRRGPPRIVHGGRR